MKLLSAMTALALAISLNACGEAAPTQQQKQAVEANPEAIRAHLEFLASDELKGRDTGSIGHEIAAKYIASEFKQMGLQPGGDNGTYFQRMPARKSYLVDRSASMIVHTDNGDVALEFPADFTTGPSAFSEADEVTAPMVFVGYGMVADEFGINDYEGLDVKGKIAVMVTGRPDDLPSEEGAHLNSIKDDLAAERGAVGIITIHTPQREKVRPYKSSLIYTKLPRMHWLDAEGKPHGVHESLLGTAYVDSKPAQQLFVNAEQSLDSVFEQLAEGQSPKGFELNASVTLSRKSRHEELTSPNVAAILPGSDESLADEYVLYTAHADHIGVSQDLSSDDNINNGAMDNAAGVSVMLETARMFVDAGQAPRRSIMFLAVTAEEKGLLGADYFANNPTVPLHSIVANVNLDMPVLLYDFADVIAFGANHSSMGDTVAKAAGKFDIKLSPDPMPEQAIFTRSDHYTLVKKGIPAVFLMTGFTSKNEDEDGGEVWGKFFAEHYHRPSDQPSLPINYDAGAVFTDINYEIGKEVANADERPHWLADSFFGKTFGGQ
ncbi:M28 family metallopeptidase [Idiomarina xiamenensis]|uniref:Aminopeptidase n=1 Tax=Idiomarina xiamenensis 10-D-4 TaxID=740709 RepID=K2K816_9GAMM|nr:M28 family metallopeptidase [Idiomarina xiamenensis]EKE83853.1 aminopeptidase [Idiomarina xiamenensis 10-D-4]